MNPRDGSARVGHGRWLASPEAYSRVTNPDRFAYIVSAMWTAVEGLEREFLVERREVDPAPYFPFKGGAVSPAVELTPTEGLPLIFLETDFPGIQLSLGAWTQTGAPFCGCDACDEQPAELLETLDETIPAATHGTFEVRLTKRRLHTRASHPGGETESRGRLKRGEWRDYPALGHHRWPPWRRREP